MKQEIIKHRSIAIGQSDFQTMIKQNQWYHDNTLLIRDLINDPARIKLIIRPRRAGKTLNLSMVRYYFDRTLDKTQKPDAANLFKDLAIWKEGASYQQAYHRYPVISISLKNTTGNIKGARDAFKQVIATAYQEHYKFLCENLFKDDEQYRAAKLVYRTVLKEESSELDTEQALVKLMEYLHKAYGEPCILLIDEYDTPFHLSMESGCYEEMKKFIGRMLKPALIKDNTHLHQAVIVGIQRVSKDTFYSDLDDMQVYSSLSDDRYSHHFGFSEEDVRSRLPAHLEAVFNQITKWYGGYQIGGRRFYNPWSILKFIHGNEANPNAAVRWEDHWLATGSGSKSFIQKSFNKNKDHVKEDIAKLMRNESIVQEIDEQSIFIYTEDDTKTLWSFLLFAGYLGIKSIQGKVKNGQAKCELIIPNNELYFFYQEIIGEWFDESMTFGFSDPWVTPPVFGEQKEDQKEEEKTVPLLQKLNEKHENNLPLENHTQPNLGWSKTLDVMAFIGGAVSSVVALALTTKEVGLAAQCLLTVASGSLATWAVRRYTSPTGKKVAAHTTDVLDKDHALPKRFSVAAIQHQLSSSPLPLDSSCTFEHRSEDSRAPIPLDTSLNTTAFRTTIK